jgi:hypothetical protein
MFRLYCEVWDARMIIATHNVGYARGTMSSGGHSLVILFDCSVFQCQGFFNSSEGPRNNPLDSFPLTLQQRPLAALVPRNDQV